MPLMIMFLRFLSIAMNGRDLLSGQQRHYSSVCVIMDIFVLVSMLHASSECHVKCANVISVSLRVLW